MISISFLSKVSDLEDIMLTRLGSLDFAPITVSSGVAQFTRNLVTSGKSLLTRLQKLVLGAYLPDFTS